MASNGKIALALLIGAAAGTALGLLFAPGSGEETRSRISDGVKDLGRKITKREDDTPDPDDLYDEVRSRVRANATRNV